MILRNLPMFYQWLLILIGMLLFVLIFSGCGVVVEPGTLGSSVS